MIRSLRAYLSDVLAVGGRTLRVAAVFVIGAALLEGIGLLSILPLFAIVIGETTTPLGQTFLDALKNVGLQSQASQLAALSFGFLLFLIIRAIVGWSRDVRLQRLSLGYVDHWRERLMRAISMADWPSVDRLRHGDMIHTVTTDVARLSVATSLLLRTLASAGLVLIQVLVVAILSPRLFLFVLVLGGIAFLIANPVTRRAAKLGQSLSVSGRDAHRALHDLLAAQKLARVSNAETQMADLYIDAVGRTREQHIRFITLQSGTRVLFQCIGGSIALGTLWIGYVVFDIPLAVLAVTLIVMVRLISPLQMITSTFQHISHALPAFDDLTQVMQRLELRQVTHRDQQHTQRDIRSNLPARIDINNLSFHRDGASHAVLQDISLAISSGEFVALFGPSGSGKTTLLDLIVGLHKATSGSIMIDGKKLRYESDFIAWRNEIAYLPQDPFLFDGTIRDNLNWANPRSNSDEDLWQVLDYVGAREALSGRSKGLELRVGERGEALSGGERQTVCLARALLRNPRCLILDEATGALDPDRESLIIERLVNLPNRPTILMVTHRTTALSHVDRTLRINGNEQTSF